MNKSMMLLLAGLAILFLTACGSSGSDNTVDEMTTKDFILISHGVPTGDCVDPDIQQYIISNLQAIGATDILFRTENSSVTCVTYNKVDDMDETGGCLALYFDDGPETCVYGFNISSENSKANAIRDVSVSTYMDIY